MMHQRLCTSRLPPLLDPSSIKILCCCLFISQVTCLRKKDSRFVDAGDRGWEGPAPRLTLLPLLVARQRMQQRWQPPAASCYPQCRAARLSSPAAAAATPGTGAGGSGEGSTPAGIRNVGQVSKAARVSAPTHYLSFFFGRSCRHVQTGPRVAKGRGRATRSLRSVPRMHGAGCATSPPYS